jgi:Flp pilus assembly pilin Flp
MQNLKSFILDEAGFTGAEKAVITLIAVGVILVIGKFIFDASKTGADTAGKQITGQGTATNLNMN